jgi:DNA polymerase bacteriophage-type
VSIKHGTFRYAEAAELLLFAWSLDGRDVWLWDALHDPMPWDLRAILEDDEYVLIAHNAAFEAAVLARVLTQRIRATRWRCSMARALAHSLPGKLEKLGQVLGLDEDHRKQADGQKLIRLFCCPPPKRSKRGWATPESHPEEWERFCSYCKQDVVAHATIWNMLPSWNYSEGSSELALWHLDQKINSRGVCTDLDLVNGAIREIDKAQSTLADRTQELTDYDPETGAGVESATQRDKLLAYLLAEYDIELADMRAATLEKLLDNDGLPDGLRELIGIRLQASTSSTSKYKRALQCVSSDDRMRGLLQFCGANRTGRWAGRIFQPQNMMRPTMEPKAIEDAIEAIKAGCTELVYA